MTAVLVPAGRGNWRRVEVQLLLPVDLFPMLRDQPVREGTRWFICERWWRVVEVRP